jgi:predicted nucleic acid-binding protein
MNDVVFVDSNILIYAHDLDAGIKQQRAEQRLRELWAKGNGRLSTQVLQEFYVNVTRKLATPVAKAAAREVVATYGSWVPEPTTVETIVRAADLAELAQISFWDALIVAAAEQCGARHIWSEDLSDGQKIVGIAIVNPLAAAMS